MFVFNDFKKRFLEGNVPSADKWNFIPVSENFKKDFEFDDFKLENYRTLEDFKEVSKSKSANYFDYDKNFNLKGKDLLQGIKINYNWEKVINDKDFSHKPMFITGENYQTFLYYYKNSVANNENIEDYLKKGGFYYIRSKDELEWFANRVEQNDSIIGVIGDNIEGVINLPIGNEEHPFQGILDGNFYTLQISIESNYTDNGIIGVLGKLGIVRNFVLKNDRDYTSIDCKKTISLNYIKTDGRDINCGLLVGRNYGIVENINAKNLGSFKIYGCVPSVYSVTNKSDDYKWNESKNIVRKKFDEKNENFMYLNSFCINSPGNICPYVGYFNEGKFADDLSTLVCDMVNHNNPLDTEYCKKYFGNWGSETAEKPSLIDPNLEFLSGVNSYKLDLNYLGNYIDGEDESVSSYIKNDFILSFYDGSFNNISSFYKNPLYYGVDYDGFITVRGMGKKEPLGSTFSSYWVENYNSNIMRTVLDTAYLDNNNLELGGEIAKCPLRPHPISRAAYNVGTIIGANFGTAQNIEISATIENTSNFVGFIGGLAGKQSKGYINNVIINVNNKLNYDFGNKPEKGDVVFYKQTPILPDSCKVLIQKLYENGYTAQYNKIVNDVFTPYFSSTNTATTINEDVISYKLRPIFVVGGMFGRYIPSFGTNRNLLEVQNSSYLCTVANSTIFYKDNFNEDNNIEKRLENSFGVIIGKVDYSTTTNNINVKESITFNNCNFSALSTVGKPCYYYDYEYIDNSFSPKYIQNEDNTYSLNKIESSSKYVGIFELKNNVIDVISYNVNSISSESGKELIRLNELGIFAGTDYPIEISSHFGGISRSHKMDGYISGFSAISAKMEDSNYEDYYFNYYTPQGYKSCDYGPLEVLNVEYIEPNFSAEIKKDEEFPDGIGNFNKQNMSNILLAFNKCNSNIDNTVQLYDDYMNNWHLFDFPKKTIDEIYSYDDISSNKITEKEKYIIQKYWNQIRSNNFNCAINNSSLISSFLGWKDEESTAIGIEFSSVSSLFVPGGICLGQIEPTTFKGTQNTFDGYTTVNPLHICYYNKTSDGVSDYDKYAFIRSELNCYLKDEDRYIIPKLFKKNIFTQRNPNWFLDSTANIEWKDVCSGVKRDENEIYFYYTYTTDYSDNNEINKKFNTLENAFGFSLDVNFTANNRTYGYITPVSSEFEENKQKISLGEHYSPSSIRYKLNKKNTFTTTAVSSNDKFGGFLVTDSSGRNVMFMENEQSTELLGNVISFETKEFKINNEENRLLLEIE